MIPDNRGCRRSPGGRDRRHVIAAVLYIGWIDRRGVVTNSVCAGVGLLLAGVMLYFGQRDARAHREIAPRIKTEFRAESQPEVAEFYYGMKLKELEHLFGKVPDDARGGIQQVRKLAAVAQSAGWKTFLENRWCCVGTASLVSEQMHRRL